MSWVIVGLGNPGEEYKNTRHNAGRMALEYFAKQNDLPEMKEDRKNKTHVSKGALGKTLLALIAPDTYMNKSGNAVTRYIKSQKAAERLIVVYDDLDLPLGEMKLSYNRGSGGHKGLESVIRAVKTKKFTRVRIGISPRTASGSVNKPSGEKEVLDFILAKFSAGGGSPPKRTSVRAGASGGKASELDLIQRVFKKASEAVRRVVQDGPMRAMNEYN